ncbi:MAG: molybdopterin molybdotransferase MoeA [Deltaproteobacteria bacterium]|nr:molybdopterin molybdotransferase MoeA [Deltaproteobacteria bacterium]
MAIKRFASLKEAFDLTFSNIPLLGTEKLPLGDISGRILAEDVISEVDSPSTDCSLKDGFAVFSNDLKEADFNNPVRLRVIGDATAGNRSAMTVSRGNAIKVTTGAPLPDGADAVLAEEFSRYMDNEVYCYRNARAGRNVLKRGTDNALGEVIAEKGTKLTPPIIGFIASAGLDRVVVYRSPRVAVIATGDEVVAPGHHLPDGKLYASNMVAICAWLSTKGISFTTEIARDKRDNIAASIEKHLTQVDAFVTSGGAWGSDRDLTIKVLEDLGWYGLYNKVKIGPGKAISFGLLEGRPFFCLPGGPPSNEIAFLQLALPGLLRMKGDIHSLFPLVWARLTEKVQGDRDWTQFIHANITGTQGNLFLVKPLKEGSRLKSMALKDALITIPEGSETIERGAEILIQLLNPLCLYKQNVGLCPTFC